MCGIIAVLLADPSAAVNQEIYDGLTSLQHRGQDAAGTLYSSFACVCVCVCACVLSSKIPEKKYPPPPPPPRLSPLTLTHPPTFTSNIEKIHRHRHRRPTPPLASTQGQWPRPRRLQAPTHDQPHWQRGARPRPVPHCGGFLQCAGGAAVCDKHSLWDLFVS